MQENADTNTSKNIDASTVTHTKSNTNTDRLLIPLFLKENRRVQKSAWKIQKRELVQIQIQEQ